MTYDIRRAWSGMMDFEDTKIGGENRAFHTTRWTRIREARTGDPEHQRIVVENLIREYWKPVYCYLRRRGYDNESAKDLTQGFFHEIVIGRDLVGQADESKGRFRTFLLTALDRYASSTFQRETAKKRVPAKGFVRLESSDLADVIEGSYGAKPEELFHYAWAVELLDGVIAQLEQELRESGKRVHWEVFREKVLGPILEKRQGPSLRQLCEKYDIESESKASNMIITVKRRFHTVLKRCLGRFVLSDSDIDAEFLELRRILSAGSAG